MMWIGEQWLAYGKIATPAQVKRHLEAVTANDIRAVAREFFQPDRYSLALVSPLKSDAGLAQSLVA
jgi:predicted Zn-dependent peptidase